MGRRRVRGRGISPEGFNRAVDVGCESGKKAYASGVEAGAAAAWAEQRGLGARWPYLCRHCDGWHVTSRAPGLAAHIDHHGRAAPVAGCPGDPFSVGSVEA